MINIAEILILKYFEQFKARQIQVQDDGAGAYISKWNMGSIPKPSKQELEDWFNSAEVQAQYNIKLNKEKNKVIYEQLNALDLKSVRSLREKNATKIAEFEAQASALRAQLLIEV